MYTLKGPTEMGEKIARKRVLCSDPKILFGPGWTIIFFCAAPSSKCQLQKKHAAFRSAHRRKKEKKHCLFLDIHFS